MQRLDGQSVLSPTDKTHHQECQHLTRLDVGVAAGEWPAPDVEVSEELQLVSDRGLEHEKKYLTSLRLRAGPLNTKSLREAIQATGKDVLAGRDCLGQALVERRVPAGTQLREGRLEAVPGLSGSRCWGRGGCPEVISARTRCGTS